MAQTNIGGAVETTPSELDKATNAVQRFSLESLSKPESNKSVVGDSAGELPKGVTEKKTGAVFKATKPASTGKAKEKNAHGRGEEGHKFGTETGKRRADGRGLGP